MSKMDPSGTKLGPFDVTYGDSTIRGRADGYIHVDRHPVDSTKIAIRIKRALQDKFAEVELSEEEVDVLVDLLTNND